MRRKNGSAMDPLPPLLARAPTFDTFLGEETAPYSENLTGACESDTHGKSHVSIADGHFAMFASLELDMF